MADSKVEGNKVTRLIYYASRVMCHLSRITFNAQRLTLTDRTIAGLIVALALLGWEVALRLNNTPVYLLPAPSDILQKLLENPGPLLLAGGVTLAEALAGLVLGSSIGLALALLLNFWAKLEQGVLSLAILIKATPLIAIAPILTIWLGYGPAPKIVVTALLTFFPVLINALSGFRAVDKAMLDLVRSWDANPWEIFIHLRWPMAQPYLFAALKVVGPLALIGAVVAEWMGASSGLGREMWLAYANLNMPALFAAVFVLTLISITLYQGIILLEKRFLFWQK
ncbi:MAG: ABC transporter permease [Anaerolineae bacterium]|nr:ABC transporter permease [Anaerolineae bacterium]